MGQGAEVEVRDLGKGFYLVSQDHGDAGHDLMSPAGEHGEHFHGPFHRMGFAKNGAVADHDGICGDDHIFGPPLHGQSLQPADPGHLVKGGLLGIHGFVNIRRAHNEGLAEQPHELPPPGRPGC